MKKERYNPLKFPYLRRHIRQFWRFRLTQPGRYLFFGVTVACFAALAPIEFPIFHFACTLLALCLVSIIAGFIFRPKVEALGNFPRKAIAGQKVVGRFSLVNRSFGPAYDVSLGLFDLPDSVQETLPPERVAMLEPGNATEYSLALTPLRRGLYPLPRIRPFTMFPFKVWRTKARVQNRLEERSLLVLPSFQPLGSLDIPMGSRYQPGGVSLTSNIGESPEYIGNRDYRPGDPMRRIDFRSWGRLARPVVREYQEEYYRRIALVLDTFVEPKRKMAKEGFADLEAAVSLAAGVADAMARGEYIIDIFAAGPNLHVFRAGRHTAHFESVLEILACVGPCRENPFGKVAPALADELNNISAVVCVLLDWDKSRERLVRAAAEAGCTLKIVVVRDGDTTEPLDSAEAWADSVATFSPETVRKGAVDSL